MFLKILAYVFGTIIAIPLLLWFALRGMFRGGWRLLSFICQHQYRELKHLCEHGTADELKVFLAAHPGAREYIVYTRHDKTTSVITSLFRLPAPLAVAGQANNLSVIPVLLANGASPEVRSVSEKRTPAEEAIGTPERMRILCGGKTWWLEGSGRPKALNTGIQEGNARGIIWNVIRGARLKEPESLYSLGFMKLPMVMKEFVCRFGIKDDQRDTFLQWVQANPVAMECVERTFHRLVRGMEPNVAERQRKLAEVPIAMSHSMQPLPSVDNDAVERLLYSSVLLERSKMLTLLDALFNQKQQFSLLKHFLNTPFSQDNREQAEEVVDILLCSILAKAEN